MKQKAFKEQVFKLLFRADFNTREELLEQVPFYFESGDLTVSAQDRARIEERLRAVLDSLPDLDGQIAAKLRNWKPERIGKVELTVIRMTAYELQHCPDVPVGVAISDAVDLAKKFGQEGAGQFVNGVLGAFVNGPQADAGKAPESEDPADGEDLADGGEGSPKAGREDPPSGSHPAGAAKDA